MEYRTQNPSSKSVINQNLMLKQCVIRQLNWACHGHIADYQLFFFPVQTFFYGIDKKKSCQIGKI